MTRGAAVLVALLVGCAAFAPRAEAQAPAQRSANTSAGSSSRSVLDGVYTPAQAKRGNEIRTASCSACHGGNDWSGNFMRGWSGRTVEDLVDHLRSSMPMDAPGSLGRQQYADLVAYMLSINGIPAGKAELKADASMKSIVIEPKKR